MASITETLPHESVSPSEFALEVRVSSGAEQGKTAAAPGRLHVGTANGNDLQLTDPAVSRFHLDLVPEARGVAVIDNGSTNGTFLGAVRIDHAIVPTGTELRVGRTTVVVGERSSAPTDVSVGDKLGKLRGASPVMRVLFARIVKAASSDVPVLLLGESGTGKELVARAIHEQSARATGPFVVVDCASLNATLVASELFGHERGAFTGAERRHEGAFERAEGGTVFLDEIGELPETLQPNLLGVLERRAFRRVGGREEIPTDVRIVAATNRDLRAEVNAGAFRLDLYYRIAVVLLTIPALRDRPEDVPLLVTHFIKETGANTHFQLPPAIHERIRRHRWPGNVRELRNFVDALVAMGEAPSLEESLGAGVSSTDMDPTSMCGLPYKRARQLLLNDFEGRYVRVALERAEGNVAKAARECQMDRSHLYELLRRHGLR